MKGYYAGLRGIVAVLLGIMVISVGLGGYGYHLHQSLVHERDQLRNTEHRLWADYHAKQAWQSVRAQDQVLVKAQLAQGVLGQQSRLQWIDQLVAHSHRVSMRDFQLHFSDHQPLTFHRVAGLTPIMAGAYYEAVDVEGYFMHEWEALSWASAVSQQSAPVALMQRCHLQLMSRNFIEEAVDYPVHLNCRWLFLVLPLS